MYNYNIDKVVEMLLKFNKDNPEYKGNAHLRIYDDSSMSINIIDWENCGISEKVCNEKDFFEKYG